jgi:hypothetical protein
MQKKHHVHDDLSRRQDQNRAGGGGGVSKKVAHDDGEARAGEEDRKPKTDGVAAIGAMGRQKLLTVGL